MMVLLLVSVNGIAIYVVVSIGSLFVVCCPKQYCITTNTTNIIINIIINMAFVRLKASQWQSVGPLHENNFMSIASSNSSRPLSPPSLSPSKLKHFGLLTFHEKLYYIPSRATSPSAIVFDKENSDTSVNTMVIERNKCTKSSGRDVSRFTTKRYNAKTDTFDTTLSNLNDVVYTKHCRRPDLTFGITKNGSRILRERTPARRNVDGRTRNHISGISDIDSNYIVRR